MREFAVDLGFLYNSMAIGSSSIRMDPKPFTNIASGDGASNKFINETPDSPTRISTLQEEEEEQYFATLKPQSRYGWMNRLRLGGFLVITCLAGWWFFHRSPSALASNSPINWKPCAEDHGFLCGYLK